MNKVKITVVKMCRYDDLIAKYENKIENACNLHLNDTFIFDNKGKPKGLCDSAWETLEPFVLSLANGKGNFFDGWMRDPMSAMLSCNDGFRLVTFLVEATKDKID